MRGSARKAVTMATAPIITPLHLSGNTTDVQNAQIREFLGEAVQAAYRAAIEQLDRHSAQIVLDLTKRLKSEVADSVVERWDRTGFIRRRIGFGR